MKVIKASLKLAQRLVRFLLLICLLTDVFCFDLTLVRLGQLLEWYNHYSKERFLTTVKALARNFVLSVEIPRQ